MTEHGEGRGKGYATLKSRKTLREILEVAASFEQTAYDFYTALIPRVGKNIRFLVEELAKEEKEHQALFSNLARNPEIESRLKDEIKTPVEDHKFSDHLQVPDLGEHPDDQTILQYALSREDAAMKQYRDLADHSEPGPIHELFEYLANEETKHKRELEAVYYELVHSGGA